MDRRRNGEVPVHVARRELELEHRSRGVVSGRRDRRRLQVVTPHVPDDTPWRARTGRLVRGDSLVGVSDAVSYPADGFALFPDRSVVALRVNGELKDLATTVEETDAVEPVTIDSPDGLDILRHSTAHVLAQAVQRINPQANLGIGPPIADGFYYDFGVEHPFTPEDLKAIDKEMQRIVREGQRFVRRVVTDDEARVELVDEPFKLELIGLKGGTKEAAEGASVEVGAGELTIYDNVDRDGQTVWRDLCRGPHLPNTRMIGNGWSLQRIAGAYWRGSEKNPQLQRIYGTAWPTKDELRAYQTRLEEAAKRDHRKLGKELDLFSFPDEIGSGLSVWHPRGGVVRGEMEQHARRRHVEGGYTYVYTPHISKEDLFLTSNHLVTYKEGMFPPIVMDEERDEHGEIVKHGQDYYLKPMNCPMHILIFKERARSYRDLPMRLAENGTVYRNELSGALHGLTRVRGFTQDDSHLFVTPEQLEEETTRVLEFVISMLRDFGLDEFELELSMRDDEKEKWIGSDEFWEYSTNALRNVAMASGLKLTEVPGEAAFYGPKIDLKTRDAIGRVWQLSTVQVDPNLPERFELEYTDRDGQKKRPIMIHRALFGSIERFFAILLEHYAGAFPVWLSPVQVVGIPVAEEYADYLGDVIGKLRSEGVRAELDHSDDRMQKKIRTHTTQKVPLQLIAGEQDRSARTVSFRFRDGSQENGVPIDDAVRRVRAAIAAHALVNTAGDFA
jgi:threonyl-tRNA synthetase